MPRVLSRLSREWPRTRTFIGAGLRWWHSELSWFVAPLVRRFGHADTRALLTTRSDGELSAPGSECASWHALCAGRETFVCLDAAQVMRLPIALPRTALPDLRNAVKYRLITDAPLPPDQLCFDVRIPAHARPGPRHKEVVAEVAVCRRSTVEALCKTLEAAGASGCVIGFSASAQFPLDFVFLISRGARKARATQRTNRLLALCAVLICLGTLPVTYLAARWQSAQILDEVRATRERQEGLFPLYEQRALVGAARHELTRYTTAPRLSNLLDDLAAHLPHTAWLHVIRYENGVMRMTGYASDPATAARSLEHAALLSRVKLNSVTRTVAGHGDAPVQFELSVSTGPQPSP